MPNVKSTISFHNQHVLNKSKTTLPPENCNCRKRIECPVDGKCQSNSIMYKAKVSLIDDGTFKEYIGIIVE